MKKLITFGAIAMRKVAGLTGSVDITEGEVKKLTSVNSVKNLRGYSLRQN